MFAGQASRGYQPAAAVPAPACLLSSCLSEALTCLQGTGKSEAVPIGARHSDQAVVDQDARRQYDWPHAVIPCAVDALFERVAAVRQSGVGAIDLTCTFMEVGDIYMLLLLRKSWVSMRICCLVINCKAVWIRLLLRCPGLCVAALEVCHMVLVG